MGGNGKDSFIAGQLRLLRMCAYVTISLPVYTVCSQFNHCVGLVNLPHASMCPMFPYVESNRVFVLSLNRYISFSLFVLFNQVNDYRNLDMRQGNHEDITIMVLDKDIPGKKHRSGPRIRWIDNRPIRIDMKTYIHVPEAPDDQMT